MHDSTAKLAYLFREAAQAQPVLLLGAGASYRSGIPLAAESVKKIAKASYCWTKLGVDENLSNPPPSDWMPYLEKQSWFLAGAENLAENFPLAVKHLLTPREQRRRFLRDLVSNPPNGISEGYRALAQIMLRRLCSTVLTTNFDSLIAMALAELRPNVREIIEINKTKDDLVRFNLFREFQIVYLHGAVEFYRDRNEQEETKQLDESLIKCLRPLLRDSPLIVVGYRGYELSVMEHLLEGGLAECQNYPNGIYWCSRAGSKHHPNVERLSQKLGSNFHHVEIEGFDELLQELDKALSGSSRLKQRGDLGHGTRLNMSFFDQRSMPHLSKADIELPLVLSTMASYHERLRLGKFDPSNAESVMLELGILVRENNKLIPSIGGYLLFGKNVEKEFPYAKVTISVHGKAQLVVEGNLISQFDKLTGSLNSPEMNPVLRIKGQTDSREENAYAALAIREACANLLMHRDYECAEIAHIDCQPGRLIAFKNPGGLSQQITEQLIIEEDGSFTPKRGVTSIRNPMLADIFYGLGRMDKAGSGLADISREMVKQGGGSIFSTLESNRYVQITLKQAQQEPAANTAVSLNPVEIFVTNLLPFVVFPKYLTTIPLKFNKKVQKRLSHEVRDALPQFIYHDDQIVSFAEPELFANYPEGELLLEESSVESLEEILNDSNRRRLVVWLLHQHWAKYLWQFSTDGLLVESKQKRAYFVHQSPYNQSLQKSEGQLIPKNEASYISYTSRTGRKVKRGVVKRRGILDKIWFENEGINYAAVSIDEQWAMQIKPMYVFTGQDGLTPLPSHAQTRRATRRFKFDRNKSVEDDLTFWARFLSQNSSIIDIGGLGVSNLILNANYTQAELPVSLVGENE